MNQELDHSFKEKVDKQLKKRDRLVRAISNATRMSEDLGTSLGPPSFYLLESSSIQEFSTKISKVNKAREYIKERKLPSLKQRVSELTGDFYWYNIYQYESTIEARSRLAAKGQLDPSEIEETRAKLAYSQLSLDASLLYDKELGKQKNNDSRSQEQRYIDSYLRKLRPEDIRTPEETLIMAAVIKAYISSAKFTLEMLYGNLPLKNIDIGSTSKLYYSPTEIKELLQSGWRKFKEEFSRPFMQNIWSSKDRELYESFLHARDIPPKSQSLETLKNSLLTRLNHLAKFWSL